MNPCSAALKRIRRANSSAQNAVDIGLYQNNGVLEVKVRPESDFSGIFSSVVFTVRWDANSGATLGESTLIRSRAAVDPST